MDKLSELVAYHNSLKEMTSLTGRRAADHTLDKIQHWVNQEPDLNGALVQTLAQAHRGVHAAFDSFEDTLSQVKTHLQHRIEQQEKHLFQESSRAYREVSNETINYLLDRRLVLKEESRKILQVRMCNHSNNRYPGMILRPGREDFIQDLVALDPLYLVDTMQEMLAPALSRFNKEYQRRLRVCVVDENSPDSMLSKIPDHQLGMCLAYYYFDFKPFEVIKRWFQEIFQKLRPGGALIMTFNDCDTPAAVRLAEQHFCSYTPGNLVMSTAQQLGYDVAHVWHDPGQPVTWLELKKPGHITSLRGGQTLAKIVANTVAKSK